MHLAYLLDMCISCDRGSRPQSVRARCRPAPTRARGQGRGGRILRRRARAGRAGAAGAVAGAHRVARSRQDGAAQRACARRRSGRLWGTGKIEARPDQSLRRPLASALHMALREIAPRHRDPEAVERVLGVLKAFALRDAVGSNGARAPRLRERWQPGIDVPASIGRADSGDMEIDLVELLSDAAELAARRRHRHRGVHRRDAGRAGRRRLGAVRGLP